MKPGDLYLVTSATAGWSEGGQKWIFISEGAVAMICSQKSTLTLYVLVNGQKLWAYSQRFHESTERLI